MNNTYPIGTPLTFVWRFLKPSNVPFYFDPDKHTFRLRYYTGRGTKDVSSFMLNATHDAITWTLPAEDEFFAGSYNLLLDVFAEGLAVGHFHYKDAFSLYKTHGVDIPDAEQAPDGATITLLSVAEFQHFAAGDSAYQIAVKHGYEGTEEEWLNDPASGIKGNGIKSVVIVGEYSSEDSAENTYRITPYVGDPFDFKVKNGKGIASIEQTASPSESEGTNVFLVTMSDGTTATFLVKNGARGNSGYSGAAEDLEVVNDLDADDPEADAAKALSAYQGYVLDRKITKLGQDSEKYILDSIKEDYYKKETIGIVIGNINYNTGARYASDTDYAISGYIANSGILKIDVPNNFYYRCVYCASNSTGSDNVIGYTDWIQGGTHTFATPLDPPYMKVVFCTNPDTPSSMTDNVAILNAYSIFNRYYHIGIDKTLEEDGAAADAKSVGDKFNALLSLQESRRNLFQIKAQEVKGITLSQNEDGSITLNGTSEGTCYFGILNDGTAFDKSAIKPGSYNAKIKGLPEDDSTISLRYGTDSFRRWVNGLYPSETVEIPADAILILQVSGTGVTFDNLTLWIEIVKVENIPVKDFYPGGITSIDYEARELSELMKDNVALSEVYSDKIQEELLAEGKVAISKLIRDHGRMLTFAYVTDTHVFPEPESGAFTCTNNINLFMKVVDSVDFGAHGGDVVESGNMTAYGAVDTYVSHDDWVRNSGIAFRRLNRTGKPVYICRGNHDVNSYNDLHPEESISNAEFNLLTRPLAHNAVYNDADSFKNYYYVDWPEYKIRMVVMNDYASDGIEDRDFTVAQRDWLENSAFDFTGKDGWALIIFDHAGKPSSSGIGETVGISALIKRFRANSNVPIIGWIHGNDHVDDYRQHTIEGNVNDAIVNVIGVDKSFLKTDGISSTNSGGVTGMLRTRTEYCVDIFLVDTENQILYETRLGRGSSRKYHYGVGGVEDNYKI